MGNRSSALCVKQLGSAALIQPRWSERIEREWVGNLLEHRPDLDPARIERTVNLMNLAFCLGRKCGLLSPGRTEVYIAAVVVCLWQSLQSFQKEAGDFLEFFACRCGQKKAP